MSPLQTWLHFFLIAACMVGVFFVLKSKLSRLLKFAGLVVLIALAIFLACEAVFTALQAQLARGF